MAMGTNVSGKLEKCQPHHVASPALLPEQEVVCFEIADQLVTCKRNQGHVVGGEAQLPRHALTFFALMFIALYSSPHNTHSCDFPFI